MSEKTEVFERKLGWKDGFAIALLVPVSIFATLGDSIAAIGSLAVALLFGISCVVGILQNYLYAELAGMFPGKPGGVALYAHEAWRRYFSPVGALAAFGYWAGWSFGVAVMAVSFGTLLQAEFFSGVTWTVDLGGVDAGLGHFLGVAALIFVSWLNVKGMRLTALLSKILGVVAAALLGIFTIGPFVTGAFDADGPTWSLDGSAGGALGGWHVALVFLFLFAWAAYGTEVCATFTPEYRDPKRDTPRSLRAAGLVTLAAATLIPVGVAGTVSDASIANDPGALYVVAFEEMAGPASALVTILMAASFLMVMNGATADSARALYGIAHDSMTIRQLDHLNRNGVPGRAVGVALVVNAALALFIGNPLGIIYASNVGYVSATFFAVSGFLLLRKDRPGWPRMVRLRAAWIPVAAVLAAYNLVLVVVGALSPEVAGYGGTTEQLIGLGVLVLSLALLAYRRLVQDRGPLRLRETTPAMPDDEGPVQAQPAPPAR